MLSMFKEKLSMKAQYGEWALVAGGAQGIGEAYCEYLAQQGIPIIVLDNDEAALAACVRRLKAKYSVSVLPLHYDLSVIDDMALLMEKLGAYEIGLLVYNAATADVGAFYKPDGSLDFELQKLNLNVVNPLRFIYALAKPMLKRKRGGIILMSSGTGLVGSPYYAHYAATKSYLINLAEGLWYEFKPYGVDVLACIAGLTTTPKIKAAIARGEGMHGKYQTPEEVVSEAFQSLGKLPRVITGKHNRLQMFILGLLRRPVAIRAIARHAVKNFCQGEVPKQSIGTHEAD